MPSINGFRSIVNPPYSPKNLLIIAGTLFVLVSVPLTVLIAQQRNNFQSKAATYLVGSGGYSSIAAAVDAAPAGSVIQIKAGTYKELVNLTKPVSLEEFGDGPVWIDGECTRGNVSITASNVILKGINMKKAKEAGIYISGADSITIDGVTVQDYNCGGGEDQYRAGVASWGGGKNLTVKNSTIKRRVELAGTHDGFGNGVWIKNTGASAGGGHYFGNNLIVGGYDGIGGEPEDVAYGSFNKDTVIENNTITDCGDDGIQSEGGNQNVIIRGNTIKRCLIGIAFTPALTGPLTILRNVISEPINRYGLGSAMFKMGDGSSGVVKIYHNSFYAGSTTSDGPKQTNGGGLSNLDFKNNAIYASRYIFETTDTPTGIANYDALYTSDGEGRFIKWGDTRYYDLAGFRAFGQEKNGISQADFGWDPITLKPNPGSPLIDKGVSIAGINDGFSGSAPDIGAFEVGGGSGGGTPTPPPPAPNPPPPPNTDTDGDGFSDELENYLGTNPLRKCGNSVDSSLFTRPSNTWPPDLHTLQRSKGLINLQDFIAFSTIKERRIGTKVGDALFSKRFDLDMDGDIDFDDLTILEPYFGQRCQN